MSLINLEIILISTPEVFQNNDHHLTHYWFIYLYKGLQVLGFLFNINYLNPILNLERMLK